MPPLRAITNAPPSFRSSASRPPLLIIRRRRRIVRPALLASPLSHVTGAPSATVAPPDGGAGARGHPDSHHHASPLASALAGALACGLVDAVLFPLDTIKVRAQSLRPLFAPGLYAGSGPSLLLKAAHGAAYMPLYFSVKGALLGLLPAPVVASVAAAAATLATAAVEVPAEALLLRLKRGGGAAGGFVGAARLALASRASFAALFAGAAPFVARHVLFEATEFAVFEAAKAKAKARARSDLHAGQGAGDDAGGGAVPLREAALAASLAGAAATLASHPLDCLRVAASLGGHGGGALGAARAILAASGPAGFAAGLAPRLAATVPASVLFFVVFEAALEGLTARGV